jgi:hypothetical protein
MTRGDALVQWSRGSFVPETAAMRSARDHVPPDGGRCSCDQAFSAAYAPGAGTASRARASTVEGRGAAVANLRPVPLLLQRLEHRCSARYARIASALDRGLGGGISRSPPGPAPEVAALDLEAVRAITALPSRNTSGASRRALAMLPRTIVPSQNRYMVVPVSFGFRAAATIDCWILRCC